MALVHEFEYLKAGTIKEALEAFVDYPDAQVLAGGTDLISWLVEDMAQPSALIDIKGIAGLDQITVDGHRMTIGCLVTFSDLLNSDVVQEKAPLLWEMAGRVASTGVRNRATPIGNICSAVPCTDAGGSLMVYEPVIHVVSQGGERDIPIADWFVGPRQTTLAAGEIATSFSFELPEYSGACWVKLGRYKGEDLAQASVAVLALPGDHYRVSFGSVAPTPIRGSAIEAQLSGKPLSEALVTEILDLVQETIAPITDIRATKEYRMEMVKVMLKRALTTAVARRDGSGPAYGTSVI